MVEHRKIYVLDADVFIAAHRRYYAFDICPGFWHSLVVCHGRGDVLSIDRIEGQLRGYGDEVSDWIENVVPVSFFVSSGDPETVAAYNEIIDWVNEQPQFLQAAKDDYARDPDGWLMAYARAKDYVVVTQEEHHPEARAKIPIPNVCLAFGIEYVNTFEMLRALSVSFVCDD